MTTLPQTTGARFPRVGTRTPSIPGLPMMQGGHAAAGPGGPGPSLTLGDVLRVLRTNLPLIIGFVTIALIAGYLVNQYVFMKYYREFTADAIMQVQTPSMFDPINGSTAMGGDRVSLEIRQKTISQKLANPNLWQPLFDNDKSLLMTSTWIKSFKTPENTFDRAAATAAIAKNLRVSPEPGSELIVASLSAPTPEDAQQVLQGITYELINSERTNATESTTDERRTLSKLLTSLNAQYDNLTNQINESSGRLNMPRDKSGGNGSTMVQNLILSQLLNERASKQKDLNVAAADAAGFGAELDAGGTPAKLEERIAMDPSVQRLDANLDQNELGRKIASDQFGAESKQVKSLASEYNAIKAQLEQRRDTLRVGRGDAIRTAMLGEVKNLQSDIEKLDAQIRNAETSLGELNADQYKYNLAVDQRREFADRKNKVEERLQILEANQSRETQKRGTILLVYDPIKVPDSISFPKLRMTMGGAAMLGLALSLGIAFLRELMDTTVRSPRDITKVGQLNLLGMIPHSDDDPQAAAGDLSLAISQTPHSIISENFRQVRTRLQHAASLDTTRSLLVTSPGPGDGKTTVACNLAAGLALNGRKILLVDANFRRPALHGIFGVTNEHGLGDVLTGQASLEKTVHPTNVPNLSVLTTGPRPANPTELLESQLLTDLIDTALEDYDHVVFDAGPILLVSETVALAPRVDGVVTVVRAKANSRGLLMRMRDTLRQLKAEHLGVVLNGVRHHTGGYYARNTKNYYAYSNDAAE